ncbi:MAG: Nramp family divalent metal transporter [Bacteroidota bacterium]
MAKIISFKQGLLSVLFWSIISAAFIGPGTVTTAAKAGATFQLQLLWALLFSTLATIVLQEAAARITIASGQSLGQIIARKYGGRSGLRYLVFLAVAFGCAAYQAGNMLGAVSGLMLLGAIPVELITLLLGLVCATLLWWGNYRLIAGLLGMVVALMGMAFIVVALRSDVALGEVVRAAVIPSLPSGSSLLLIGLIGTTIVPYNLFLASGISKGQDMREMRIGISLAVGIGGLISIAILVVGTQISGGFSFEALAAAMGERLGIWATLLFSFGLFAAGLTSSITSPLAAAITAQSLFAEDGDWGNRSRNFRLVWGIILTIGLLFGLTNFKPVPVIILAQAINGILLPVVTIFLLLAVNDRAILPERFCNGHLANAAMLLIVGLSCFLGFNNLGKALFKSLPILNPGDSLTWTINAVWSGIIVLILARKVMLRSA